MIPARLATSSDNTSEQTPPTAAAKYNIRYEIQLVPDFGDHRRVAVPKNLIIVGWNEDPACIVRIRFGLQTRCGHPRNIRILIGRNSSLGLLQCPRNRCCLG